MLGTPALATPRGESAAFNAIKGTKSHSIKSQGRSLLLPITGHQQLVLCRGTGMGGTLFMVLAVGNMVRERDSDIGDRAPLPSFADRAGKMI